MIARLWWAGINKTTPAPRKAFSLIEMLVVLAILLLIMSILALAYHSATWAMRVARGWANLGAEGSGIERQLRFLLRQHHFEGSLRVSQIDPQNVDRRALAGYFAVYEGNTSPSEIDVDDVLAFTVRLTGNSPGDFFETSLQSPPQGWSLPPNLFTANLSPTPLPLVSLPDLPPGLGFPESRYQLGNTYRSQWAEVVIFLSRQHDPENPTRRAATVAYDHAAHPDPPTNGPAARLYRLHIRRFLLAPSHFAKGPHDFDPTGRIVVHRFQPPQNTRPYYYPDAFDLSLRREVTTFPQPGGQPTEEWVLNTARDVRDPANRCFNRSSYFAPRPWESNELPNDFPPGPPGPLTARSGRLGSDLVLQNVVSFDVKLVTPGGLVDANYDSASDTPLPGLWIRLRIYNPRTDQMRDLVILEAL
ncbi:MAG: prepilin-type N-terminal cleavage/methylation domain-containing protein [Gemmatales bacterium]|nr:prepilin-type N-terminal cleavage/methylation domain-containing protein [Gemmatales bacterium]MDW7995785.1 prepilin-type N-terminal cleavage/methylation domain-containing protein [Gemmatales bacterium]